MMGTRPDDPRRHPIAAMAMWLAMLMAAWRVRIEPSPTPRDLLLLVAEWAGIATASYLILRREPAARGMIRAVMLTCVKWALVCAFLFALVYAHTDWGGEDFVSGAAMLALIGTALFTAPTVGTLVYVLGRTSPIAPGAAVLLSIPAAIPLALAMSRPSGSETLWQSAVDALSRIGAVELVFAALTSLVVALVVGVGSAIVAALRLPDT